MPTFRQSLRLSRIDESNEIEDLKAYQKIVKVAKKYGVTLIFADASENYGLVIQAEVRDKNLPTIFIDKKSSYGKKETKIDVAFGGTHLNTDELDDFAEMVKKASKFCDFVESLDLEDLL